MLDGLRAEPAAARSTRAPRSTGAAARRRSRGAPPGAMLVIISGPSGVGKDTIIDALRRRPHDTGPPLRRDLHDPRPRPGEVDGVSYHFLDARAFLALRDAGELLEANKVHGNWYGTPREQVREALAAGRDVDPQDRRPGRPAGQGAGRPRPS